MLSALFLQILQNLCSCLTLGEPFAEPWVLSVVAKLIGDEAMYTSGNGSINEKLLERDIAA